VQPVASDAVHILLGYQRLVDQRGQNFQHLACQHVLEGADPADIFQGKSAGEDAQAPQHGLLDCRQQLVAPVDGVSKRLMTRQRNPRASRKQTETVTKTFEDLLDRENPCSDRSQLDRQGQTIKPSTKTDDGHLVGATQLETARCGRRPLGKQHDGLVLLKLLDGSSPVLIR